MISVRIAVSHTLSCGSKDWYLHLSSHFLAARSGKLLVLAGQERLDKELMVGQMWVDRLLRHIALR